MVWPGRYGFFQCWRSKGLHADGEAGTTEKFLPNLVTTSDRSSSLLAATEDSSICSRAFVMSTCVSSDNAQYHCTASSPFQYELERSHHVCTGLPSDTCTCCRCCCSCYPHHSQDPNFSCRTCESSRFHRHTSILDTERILYYASRMQHIPEVEEIGDPTTVVLPRPSRFHEQLSSRHTPVPSLHESASFHPPLAPGPSPVHIVRRLTVERKRRARRKMYTAPWVSKLKLRLGRQYKREENTSSFRPFEVMSTPRRTRNSSTVSTTSDCRRGHPFSEFPRYQGVRCDEKACKKRKPRDSAPLFAGGMWGYDPNAGRLMTQRDERTTSRYLSIHTPEKMASTGCYIFRGKESQRQGNDEDGSEEIDEFGRRTGKTWVYGTEWGIESGGPGKQKSLSIIEIPAIVFDDGQDRGIGKRIGKQRSRKGSQSPWPISRGSLAE